MTNLSKELNLGHMTNLSKDLGHMTNLSKDLQSQYIALGKSPKFIGAFGNMPTPNNIQTSFAFT
jgi:hypothetical protein